MAEKVTLDPNNIYGTLSLAADNMEAWTISYNTTNRVCATLGRSSGKFYFEVVSVVRYGGMLIGIVNGDSSTPLRTTSDSWVIGVDWIYGTGHYSAEYVVYHDTNNADWDDVYGRSVIDYEWRAYDQDVIGVAVDFNIGTIRYFINNTEFELREDHPSLLGVQGTVYPVVQILDSDSYTTPVRVEAIFAEEDFNYSPPEGYLPWEGEVPKMYFHGTTTIDTLGNPTTSGVDVRLFTRDNNTLVDSVVSTSSGTFTLCSPYIDTYHYAIAFYPENTYNALIYDWLKTEA